MGSACTAPSVVGSAHLDKGSEGQYVIQGRQSVPKPAKLAEWMSLCGCNIVLQQLVHVCLEF